MGSSNTPAAPSGREVLPTSVRPSHYVVHLVPDLEKFTFDGSVVIDIKFLSATNTIAVNTNELTVKSAKLNNISLKTEEVFEASSITANEKLEQTSFTFAKEFPAGTTATLSIEFSGILNDKMAGFYRSAYTDSTGAKKFIGVTQFEATDARRAFPCWDEPNVKATFDIILSVPNGLVALSNMNVISQNPDPKISGRTLFKFAKSPIMSTYLVAFAVGDFEYIESHTASTKFLPGPVKVRTYTLKGSVEQGRFALNCAVKVLEYFAEVFEIPYPLPKLDMLAVPDFSAGAMENWGLVTYRTVYLLFDEKTSSARSKQNIAYVVSHELAHQWFGNLVTMDWWTDLWLNEGFATYVGWLAVDHMFPEWDIWTHFVMDEMQRALSLDALRSSHPIEVEVRSPSEIGQIFDAISYSKGASVIRMLSNWLGVDNFLAGVRSYLKKYKYKNAVTLDLWNSLSEHSGVNVAEFMHLWTKQTGYPVLTVAEEGNGKIKLSQKRFLSSGKVLPEDDTVTWWCPLSIITPTDLTGSSSEAKKLLKTKSESINLPVTKDSKGGEFYKINYRQNDFFRVLYPSKNVENLGKAVMKGSMLTVSDRVGIIADVFALANAGVSSTVDCLRLLKYFEGEKEYIALNEVGTRLSTLKSTWAMEPKEVTDRLQAFTRKIFAKQAKEIGWEFSDNEGHLKSMLRTLVIGAAGVNGDKEIIEQAKTRFQKFISGDESTLHPNIRGTTYAIVLKYASNPRETFNAVRKIYETTTNVDQKMAALTAIGRVEDQTLLKELLEWSMNEDNVRAQDLIYPLASVGNNHQGRRLAWEFVKSNWSKLEERYASVLSLLGRCLTCTTQDWASEEFAKEVETFFADKNVKPVARPLEQSLEKIRAQAAWLNRDRESVAKWLMAEVTL